MKKYKIELNENQLATLSLASEIYARLTIGQFNMAFDCLPLQEFSSEDYGDWHADMDTIRGLVSKYTINNVDGYSSSLGIYNEKTDDSGRVAWDLYQVFRHRLSWDRAIEEGIVESEDSERDWSNMMGVCYDIPMKSSKQPLAKVEKKKDEK